MIQTQKATGICDWKPPPMDRMHFLALGVSQYSDPQITKLDFAARGAGVMASLFREQAEGLYRTTTSELLDRDAIRPLWRKYTGQAARELSADVHPDDLVVMYVCGHGIRDRRTNQWYFVTADAKYNELINDRYSDLLSFDDLAMLGELPCRKLAIIDSCHRVPIQETIQHVIEAAAEDSRTTGFIQHPTAGPADLFETLTLPSTRIKPLD